MATGKRLLDNCMPSNYRQGTLYPVYSFESEEKPYGNKKSKNAGHVRKAGQSKLRNQLKKELLEELDFMNC